MSKRYIAFWVITPFGIVGCVWLVAALVPTDVSGAAHVVQAVLVGSAVVVGSTLAAVRLGLFREFEPHVIVDQEVSHRSVSESYVHVSCAVTIRNTSKVAVWISRAEFSLLLTSRIDNEFVEDLYDRRWERNAGGDLQWPPLDHFERDWDDDGLTVEPGSSHQETCEFLIRESVESVILRSYFENGNKRSSNRGWFSSTFYDLTK